MKKRKTARILSGLTAFILTFATVGAPVGESGIFRVFDTKIIANAEEADGFEYEVNDGGAVLKKYTGTETDITIPSAIDGKAVTRLEDRIFKDNKTIKAVVIPSSVTTLGWSAFENCSSLESVTIPASVTNFGDGLFDGCSEDFIIKLDAPSCAFTYAVENNFKYEIINYDTDLEGREWYENIHETTGFDITSGDFIYRELSDRSVKIVRYTGSDTNITFPAELDGKKVSAVAPRQHGSWEGVDEYVAPEAVSVTFESGIKWIGGVCANDTSLTKVTLPDTIEFIDENAFAGCTNLTRINLPDGLKLIGDSAFRQSGLTSITLPEGLEEIGGYAFAQMPSLRRITVPSSVKKIGGYAFLGSDIRSVTFSEGLEEIGDCAFASCSKLGNITLPSTLKKIGDWVFRQDTAMTSINIPEALTEIGDAPFTESNIAAITLEGKRTDIGRLFKNTKVTSVVLPDGLTEIADEAFAGCYYLTSVTIPDSVKRIGKYAFSQCAQHPEKLTINFPAGLEEIDEGAFSEARIGGDIVFPESLKTIGEGAFRWAGEINEGYECFIDSVTISSTVENIGADAFRGSAVKKVMIEDGVTAIPDQMFSSCTVLESVTLPKTLKTIGEQAFQQCEALKAIDLPEGLTSIGAEAFDRCYALESIAIPTTMTEIKDSTFVSCKSLTSVTIPGNIETIGNDAFASCVYLRELTLGDGIEVIGRGAFFGCYSLLDVTVPASVVSIGHGAFGEGIGYYTAGMTGGSNLYDPSSASNATIVGFKIHCYKDTEAEYYAQDMLFDYELLDTGESFVGEEPEAIFDYEEQEDGTIAINSLEGIRIPGRVNIPETLDGKPVTAVYGIGKTGGGSFLMMTGYTTQYMREVTIPDTVKSFTGCANTNISSVKLPNSLEIIGPEAFYNCDGLTSIEIPETVTTIGFRAFAGTSIEEAIIPDSVTTFEAEFTTQIIPADCTPSSEAFAECKNLKKVKLSSGCNTLVKATFRDCPNLEEVTNNEHIVNIEPDVFSNCTSLTDKCIIGESAEFIGHNAFYYCTGLTAINIPDTVNTIESSAFEGCTGLRTVVVPQNVTFLGQRAFYNIPDLKEVTFLREDTEFEEEYNYRFDRYYLMKTFGYYKVEDEYGNGEDTTEGMDLTIRGYNGSTAQYVANYWGFAFEPIYEDDSLSVDLVTKGSSDKYSDERVSLSFDDEEQTVVKSSDAVFRFLDIPDGTYEMTISAENFVPRKYSVEIKDGVIVNAETPELHLIGDITGDGQLNNNDLLATKSHIKGINKLTDYDLDVANADMKGSVNNSDLLRMKSHMKGINKLW